MTGILSRGAGAVSRPRFDPSVPHPARVYNYWLGGKDHWPADRAAAKAMLRERPGVVAGARANRAFAARVVRYLAAEQGIRQFVDIGAGLPTLDNTHQIAQRAVPECRVVYCDNDPLVVVHARALLTCRPPGVCGVAEADVRDPATVLSQAARTLDLGQPAAILLFAVLHFIADDDDPAGIVARLADGLAPGSFVALSHLTGDFAPGEVAAAAAAYNRLAPVPVIPRTHAQISGLFGGLPVAAPGVVEVTEWPAAAGMPFVPRADLYGGLARVRGAGR